jgi:hypothetical protein
MWFRCKKSQVCKSPECVRAGSAASRVPGPSMTAEIVDAHATLVSAWRNLRRGQWLNHRLHLSRRCAIPGHDHEIAPPRRPCLHLLPKRLQATIVPVQIGGLNPRAAPAAQLVANRILSCWNDSAINPFSTRRFCVRLVSVQELRTRARVVGAISSENG